MSDLQFVPTVEADEAIGTHATAGRACPQMPVAAQGQDEFRVFGDFTRRVTMLAPSVVPEGADVAQPGPNQRAGDPDRGLHAVTLSPHGAAGVCQC